VDDTLFERAVETWGEKLQEDMVIEECAEVIDAVCKWRRGRIPIKKVVEEMIDVEAMLYQMRYIVGYDEWDKMRDEKFGRLENRLENANRKTRPS